MTQNKIFALGLFGLWFTLLVCFYIIISYYNISIEEGFFTLYHLLRSDGFYGPMLFILLYTLRPLFFIIASPFSILCGFVYGFPSAFFVFFTAEILSILFSYSVGYFTWGKLLVIPEKFSKIKKIEKKLLSDTFFTLFRLRLLAFPYDLLNYISWVLRLPFKKYFFGTLFGIFPFNIWTLSIGIAFYGENIQSFSDIEWNIDIGFLLLSWALFLLSLIFSRYLTKKKKS